jgi:hypothetical protein
MTQLEKARLTKEAAKLATQLEVVVKRIVEKANAMSKKVA